MLELRKYFVGTTLATILLTVGGCHIARKPEALIEPTFSHLDRATQPTFTIAAYPPD